MSESKKYYISSNENTIIRHTPWPWHRQNKFKSEEVISIDYGYSSHCFKLKFKNGRTLRLSIMLRGIIVLINSTVSKNTITLSENVKFIMKYYNFKSPNKKLRSAELSVRAK